MAVPLVVWLSVEYRAMFPDVVAEIENMASKPLRLDRLQSILLPLARVVHSDSGRPHL